MNVIRGAVRSLVGLAAAGCPVLGMAGCGQVPSAPAASSNSQASGQARYCQIELNVKPTAAQYEVAIRKKCQAGDVILVKSNGDMGSSGDYDAAWYIGDYIARFCDLSKAVVTTSTMPYGAVVCYLAPSRETY